MSNLIIRKEKSLPSELKVLLYKEFNPTLHPEILYLPSYFRIQSLAKVSYIITRFLTVLFGAIFIYASYSYFTKNQDKPFYKDEGVTLTFLMFCFSIILFLISFRYYKKSRTKQKLIDSNELRLGLWITPTHLMTKDLNSGMECVAIKDILSLSTNKLNSVHMSFVLVHLINKQTFRIAANFLPGFSKREEELKVLIEEKITKKMNEFGVINEFFNEINIR